MAFLDRLAAKVAGLHGWRRYLLAAAAGAFGALGFAPYNAWPVLFVSFGVLVWLLDGAFLRHEKLKGRLIGASLIGFSFGYGFFLANFYWIAEAFLVEPERHAWLIPFVLAAFPAWMALYFVLACMLAMLLWGKGATRVFALAFAFAIGEYVRGHLFTGQPWNLIGYSLTANLPMMQMVSLTGIYALTLFAVLLFASVLAVFAPKGLEGRASATGLALIAVALLAAGTGWGYWRLAHAPREMTDLSLRIVQTSVAQNEKWRPENARAIFEDYLAYSRETKDGVGLKDIDILIWPETAIPAVLPDEPEALSTIGEMLPDGTRLLVGSIRIARYRNSQGMPLPRKFFNSLLIIGGKGRIQASYDKIHLVPFGEYLPFQSLLERMGVMQLTGGIRGGFTGGKGSRRLRLSDAPPLMPLICYEILFPDEVNAGEQRAGWMVNVTNDAWFGRSVGPYQHFHHARVRAVEQGLPLVRAANTGISAIIDPYGRIEARLGLGKKGVVDGVLPNAIPPTFFALHERGIEILSLFLVFIGTLGRRLSQLTGKLMPSGARLSRA